MRLRNTVLAVMLAASGGVAVAAPAYAEPAGCSHTTPSFWVSGSSGNYQMHSDSSASCNTSSNRTFRVEIKQDIAFQPDPVAGADEDNWTGTSYYAYARTCDHGNNSVYYGNSFFTSSPTYHESPHYYVETCA